MRFYSLNSQLCLAPACLPCAHPPVQHPRPGAALQDPHRPHTYSRAQHTDTCHTCTLPTPIPSPASCLPITPTAFTSLCPLGTHKNGQGPRAGAATSDKSLLLSGPQLPSCKGRGRDGEDAPSLRTLPVQHPAPGTEGEHFEGHPSSCSGVGREWPEGGRGGRVSTLRCRQLGPPKIGGEGEGGNLDVVSVT